MASKKKKVKPTAQGYRDKRNEGHTFGHNKEQTAYPFLEKGLKSDSTCKAYQGEDGQLHAQYLKIPLIWMMQSLNMGFHQSTRKGWEKETPHFSSREQRTTKISSFNKVLKKGYLQSRELRGST